MADPTKVRNLVTALWQHGEPYARLGLELVALEGARAQVALRVTPAVCNPLGNLHGGVTALLVDEAGTVAIMAADRDGRPGVTTDLNVSYLAPTPAGQRVVAHARVLKVGRTLAFVEVEVRRDGDGGLVASGRMTKFLAGAGLG